MTENAVKIVNILLVEDDPDDVVFFTEALQDMADCIKIFYANNCVQLFNQLDSGQKFDIIFIDISLPITNGIECLTQLKEKIKFQHIPVVMLTGSHAESDVTDTFEKGAHNFISKPHSAPE